MRANSKRGILAKLKASVAHRRSQGGLPDRKVAAQGRLILGLILLATAFSQPSHAYQLSANQILNKVSETYQSLRSYHFVAEENAELATGGEIRSPSGTATSNFHKSTQTRVELAAAIPGKVRLMVKDDNLDILMVSDGQTTWTYLPKRKQYSEVLGTPAEPTGGFRPDDKREGRILGQYWNLLVGRFRGVSQFISIAKLENDNRIKVGGDKVDCYVVRVQAPDLTHEMWVDKNRFIILRYKQTPLRPLEGMAFQTTITVNMTEAEVNTHLEDSLFKFTAPQNATTVPSLNPNSKRLS
jgi:outer membrane lipoprotein-sorting protein